MGGADPAGRTRVVVADDEAAVREMVADALARHGYEVSLARDGFELAEALGQQDVDLVVTDIHMPGLSGFEALDAARGDSPQASFIVITGNPTLDCARRAARRGACDFLPKPFSERELMEAVSVALARRMRERDHAREQELQDLFEFSEAVSAAPDPWEMLKLAAGAALTQTRSDAACFGGLRDGHVWPLLIGACRHAAVFEALDESDVIAVAARSGTPLLLTPRSDHPLGGLVDVRTRGQCALGRTGETLVAPVRVGKQPVGALAVARDAPERPYSRGDFQVLGVLAASAGLLLKNGELVESLQHAYVGAVHSMARMVEAKDRHTHGHSARVAEICGRIARRMGVSAGEIQTLETAAGLHDVGKVAVPDAVLNKPGRLTAREWQAVRAHPLVGADMIAPAAFLAHTRPLVLHHHERYDGAGYPHGARPDELSALTHIIIAADAWDAMTSDRPYRPALTTAQALAEMDANRGTQFHPEVADAVIALMQ